MDQVDYKGAFMYLSGNLMKHFEYHNTLTKEDLLESLRNADECAKTNVSELFLDADQMIKA